MKITRKGLLKFSQRNYSDDELIKGLQEKPDKWKRIIYKYFKKDLRNYCKSRMKYEEVLFEGAYDDVMMDFYKKVADGKYEKRSKLTTFLIKVFHRKYTDNYRKHYKKISLYSDEVSEAFELKDEAQKVFQHFMSKENLQLLAKLLNEVGKNCYEIIKKHAEGFDDIEIASMFGLKNAKTVKSRRYQCRKKLFNYLSDNNLLYEF